LEETPACRVSGRCARQRSWASPFRFRRGSRHRTRSYTSGPRVYAGRGDRVRPIGLSQYRGIQRCPCRCAVWCTIRNRRREYCGHGAGCAARWLRRSWTAGHRKSPFLRVLYHTVWLYRTAWSILCAYELQRIGVNRIRLGADQCDSQPFA
jgi:hypothetical protein